MTRWLLAALIIAVALFSLLMRGERLEREAAPAAPAPTGPDYWIETGHIERFDDKGRPILRVDAERMAHFPLDERMELNDVQAEQLGEGDLRWLMYADHGLIPGDRERVNLWGDVRMERRPGAELVTYLYSDSLVFYPQQDLARTEDAVRMERGASVTTGIGLLVDMSEDRMSIKHEVWTRYVSEDN